MTDQRSADTRRHCLFTGTIKTADIATMQGENKYLITMRAVEAANADNNEYCSQPFPLQEWHLTSRNVPYPSHALGYWERRAIYSGAPALTWLASTVSFMSQIWVGEWGTRGSAGAPNILAPSSTQPRSRCPGNELKLTPVLVPEGSQRTV